MSANTCASDCGGNQVVCGDGICNGTENASTCASDCGGSQAACGDGTCNGTETQGSCPADCGSAAICGDGTCNGTENQGSCPGDCGSAAVCGDGTCNGTETTTSCPGDCAAATTCGDFVCDDAAGECLTCFLDCLLTTVCTGGGTCDHDVCALGTPLDSSCGSCEAAICAADDYCCTTDWDQFCIDAVATECGGSPTCP
jgi:hypothetical protein